MWWSRVVIVTLEPVRTQGHSCTTHKTNPVQVRLYVKNCNHQHGKCGREKSVYYTTFMPEACHLSRALGTSSKTSPFNSLFSNPVSHMWP